MPSSTSFSAAAALSLSMAPAKRGFDVSVCSSACAASSVADAWQCSRMSSRSAMMGAHLYIAQTHTDISIVIEKGKG